MERDLGSPLESPRQTAAQAFQQPDVPGVANGIAIRVKPQAGTKANRARRAGKLFDRDMSQFRPFDAAVLAARHPYRVCRGVLAQPRLIATEQNLPGGLDGQLP